MNFLAWIKVAHQSPNFETLKCSSESAPYSSCHFRNHNPVFFQTVYHSSESCKITLYFFRSNVIYFPLKEPIKVEILRISNALVKIHQILVIFETENQFSSNFALFVNVMRHKSSIIFQLKFYTLLTKIAYQSTNLVAFQVSSRKSETLCFDGFLLSKSYKVSAKKVQKSYLS